MTEDKFLTIVAKALDIKKKKNQYQNKDNRLGRMGLIRSFSYIKRIR